METKIEKSFSFRGLLAGGERVEMKWQKTFNEKMSFPYISFLRGRRESVFCVGEMRVGNIKPDFFFLLTGRWISFTGIKAFLKH